MKRNRKIFAILTLVAFMMTLLPMAAFAADRHNSILRVDTTKVEADGKKDAEFTVYVRNSSNQPVGGAYIYVASERGTTDYIAPKAAFTEDAKVITVKNSGADTIENRDTTDRDVNGIPDQWETGSKAKILAIKTNDSGKAEFTVVSRASGDARIAVGLAYEDDSEGGSLDINPYTYFSDSDVTATKAEIIGTQTITFTATKTNDVKLVDVKNRSGDNYNSKAEADDKIEDNVSGSEGDRTYFASGDGLEIPDSAVSANGIDYFELTFAVSNSSNAPVEGEKVKISANKSDVSFNVTEKETNEVGEAKFKVYAKKAGTYKVTADIGGKKAAVWLTFSASEIADLRLAGDVDPLVAINEDGAASFKLEFLDANGYTVDPRDIQFGRNGDTELDFEWITEPSDSDLDDDWAYVDKNAGEFDIDDYVSFTVDNLLKVTLPEIEEEGKYVLRVNIENGKYVDVKFEAREQGDIERITIKYDEASLELGAVAGAPTVKRYDAAGVALEVKNDSELEFSINDYRAILNKDVEFESSNINARALFADKGVLFVTDDDDYVGEYVVTVIDTKEDLTASTEITVGNAAIGLDLEYPVTLPVGVETPIKLSVLDDSGRVVGLGTGTTVEFNTYVTKQPTDANASAEATTSETKFAKDLREKGYANVDVYSKVAGEVQISFVVKVTKQGEETVTLTKNATFNFAEPKEEVIYGAKNVTMFIGSTGFVADGTAGTMDQAPFIQDNRTFVPLRAVATALGATNEDTMWDPATQTITLVRPDLTVTMTIGSNVLTLSDGSTVVADVAPFIVAETGRTVIPFRAIAEAFGADVEAVFAADGTTTAVTFSQE